jgi:hypothetical protein
MTTPRWARLREELAGDLEEIYTLRAARDGDPPTGDRRSLAARGFVFRDVGLVAQDQTDIVEPLEQTLACA